MEKFVTHEVRRIAGAVQAARRIVPEEVRHNILVVEVGDHILAELWSPSVAIFGF